MASSADNAFKGRVNETALAYYVNGSKWPDATTRRENKEKIKELNPDDVLIETGKAKEMAKSFLEKASEMGYRGVKEVYWIGVPGDTTNRLKAALDPDGSLNIIIDPKRFPADLMVHFQSGHKGRFESWLGLSAKSSMIKSGKIGFKNLGLGTLDKILGLKLSEEFKVRTADFVKKNNLDETADKRKVQIRKNKKLSEIAGKAGDKMLEEFRDEIWKKLARMNFDQAHEHVIKYWMNAENVYPPYLKVTGAGTKPPFNVIIENPKDNEKLTALNQGDIKFIKTGIHSISVMTSGKRLFNIRLAFDSEKMAGSIKVKADA